MRSRNLNLTLGGPLCLTLAADARLSPVNYADDLIWQVALGSGTPPALALESSLGLRARSLRIFPRFLRQENDLLDPLEFSEPPIVQRQLPGYMLISAAPFSGIYLTLEFWIAASSLAAGRITLRNGSILHETLRMQLCGLLSPLGEGSAFTAVEMGASTVLVGKTSGLAPVVFITGGPQAASGPYPNLSNEIDLDPGDERQLSWAFAALPEVEDSFQLARLTTSRPFDAEITRAEMLHNSQRVDVHTPNADWNAALQLGQVAAMRLLMPPRQNLPNPSFVLAREPEHGFSMRGDGSDYTHLWNGSSVLDAWYLAGCLLPGAPALARGLVDNFLASSRDDGFIDFTPGAAGERRQHLAQPLLASLAWRIHSADPDPAWLKQIFPGLLAFVQLWLSDQHDRDGDGYPEWDHPLQTGLEQAPIYDRWHIQSQGADIRQLECPGLGAMLYRECRSLIEMARLLKKKDALAWLEEHAEVLRLAVEAAWDERAHTYRYHDSLSHQSLPGTLLAELTENSRQRLRRKFTPARHIHVCVQSTGESSQIIRILLRGEDDNGAIEEEITLREMDWLHGSGRANSQHLYRQIETIEVSGLSDGDTAWLRTIDYTQEDISLLLPLWAGIPTPERARALVESTILTRYMQPYGLSTCPASADPPENPDLGCALLPWNALVGEGLLRYGYRDLAAELFSRLMRAQVITLQQERAFRAPFCSIEQPASGEKNSLSALPPFGMFWQILGLYRISNKEVILQNQCPLPGPITVQYQGMDITFQTRSSVVRFASGESVTVTKPGLRRING